MGPLYMYSAVYSCCVFQLFSQFGLYSAFMGCFTYVLLGTSKDITMGPTAIMSLIVASVIGGAISDGADPAMAPIYAAALCLLCGIIQLVMGLLNLGEQMHTH